MQGHTDTMTNQLKTSSENNTCRWCGKNFKSERTLVVHMCVKKRRNADKEMTHVRLGYRVFQMFYELNTTASKTKSIEEFINQEELIDLMKKNKFENCSYRNLSGGIVAIHSGWKI